MEGKIITLALCLKIFKTTTILLKLLFFFSSSSRLDRTHLRRREEHSSFEMLRPGFARISLPYFMPEAEVAFVLEALKMVATEAWKLLPQYILNPETGEWRHRSNLVSL